MDFDKLDKVVDNLSDAQRRAILLFGTTDNLYRYHDNEGFYNEGFLWDDSRWTIESAPWNVLDSLYFKGLVKVFYSKYCGIYYFLTPLGKAVLETLRARENLDSWIKQVKMDSRPPGGLRL